VSPGDESGMNGGRALVAVQEKMGARFMSWGTGLQFYRIACKSAGLESQVGLRDSENWRGEWQNMRYGHWLLFGADLSEKGPCLLMFEPGSQARCGGQGLSPWT
jgi:hypothetical protein